MTKFTKGQRVKVEYEAKVWLSDLDGVLELRTDDDMFYYINWRTEPSVTITPLGLADWPPQVGDIWEAGGKEWFARKDEYAPTGRELLMVAEIGTWLEVDEVKALNPVLVRRRGQ